MPGCCVPYCKNRSERGFRLFSLPQGPKNVHRRQAWLKFIDRRDLPARANICEAHFEENQFEYKRIDNRKLLKWDAVPSIPVQDFQGPPSKKICVTDQPQTAAPTTSFHTTIKIDENHSMDLDNFDNENSNDSVSGNIKKEEYVNNLQYDNLKSKLKNAHKKIKSLEKRIEQMEEKYKQVFNSDQTNFLITGTHKGVQWSDETIDKSLKLYTACGAKGYEEIRRQNLPYPCIRTLQHRMRDFKFESGVLEEDFHQLQFKIKIKEEET